MGKFKGTTGEWYAKNGAVYPQIHVRIEKRAMAISCFLWDSSMQSISTSIESQANAQLIADAGNVRQQISFDLPELLRQRDELLDVLESIENDNNCIPAWMWEKIKTTIKSCKQEH